MPMTPFECDVLERGVATSAAGVEGKTTAYKPQALR